MKEMYVIECCKCHNGFIVMADPADVKSWEDGALIQEALPYLDVDKRELFKTGICPYCWDNMFGEECD